MYKYNQKIIVWSAWTISFRCGAVPYTRKSRGGSYYRSPKTLQELRSSLSKSQLEDNNISEANIAKLCKKRKLRTCWDDVRRNLTRSWKSHRNLQHH